MVGVKPCLIYRYRISIVDISPLLNNIDVAINKGIWQSIDIDKAIMENIDIDKKILENINIDKILNRLEFGISNRAIC